MSQNDDDDDDRVGPRSWYWSNRIKVLLAAALIAAVLMIMILVNPGPGSNSGGASERGTPAVPRVVPTISHRAHVQLERTVFHANRRPSVMRLLWARATQPEVTKARGLGARP